MLRLTFALMLAAASLPVAAPAQVSYDRLLHSGENPQDWLS